MEDIASLIEVATEALRNAGIPEPRREAASLLEYAIARPRTFLIAHSDHIPTAAQTRHFRECIARRAFREPFHYITGSKEFYGLEFKVSPDVLIPRPETEMLVERSIEILAEYAHPRFCEVGVGSGCISIALLVNIPAARATGLDISPAAMTIAMENAVTHDVAPRFGLASSDVFDNLAPGKEFELIISNPPYIPAADILGLQPEVRDHEPSLALTDGGDGHSIIRRLVNDSPQYLMPGGRLLFEFGFGQAEQVRTLFSADTWRSVQFKADLQGIPRIVEVERK